MEKEIGKEPSTPSTRSTSSTPRRYRNDIVKTRPPNAWIMYLKDKRAEIEYAGFPILEPKDVFSYVSKQWKEETTEVRATYNNMWRQGMLLTFTAYKRPARLSKEESAIQDQCLSKQD